jgi:chromosome segregation ATPase
MSRSREDLLDEIEDLKDHIHDLNLDLKSEHLKIQELERQNKQLSSDVSGLMNENVRLTSLTEKLESEVDKEMLNTEKVQHSLEDMKLLIKNKSVAYSKMLCMWETVRMGNYQYFETR